MECDNAYNSNDDFEDREDTAASKDEENARSSSSAIGSPHSVFTSPDFQELTTSASSSNKVLGHNYNGTVVFTNGPKNEAELQLYRVMQRASLLSYFDTLLEMGGDDVQQLCDAGEEEFLEIMALVGMASKPLHVRRFQKALQEWLTNPLMFQIPLSNASASPRILPRPLSVHNVSSSPLSCSTSLTNLTPVSSPNNAQSQQLGEISSCTSAAASSPVHGSISSLSSSPCPSSPVHAQNSQPILDEQQIKKLEKAATRLVESLPELEPKYPNTKKKIGKELQAVLNMSEDDPLRMQHIRKFSAIYGRFDCKRKPEKPLTLHEVSVNEAAAQICKHIPALLTRRDELFPLARRVVRDSGYQYSKGHSKSFAANNFTKSAPLMNTFRFHDNFNKRKNSMENIASSEGSIANEEKLNSLRTEIQKVTDRIEQLTNETQNISEEACEFSASKYQLEAFNRQKLQLLEEYKMLLNHNNIPKKRGRKSKHYMAFHYERTSHDDNSLPDFNGDEIENSNDSQNYDDEDTKSSEITYIQDACSEKDEHGELESMHEEYDRFGENSSEMRRAEDLDGYEEKHYKERLIAEEKFQVVACKGDNIIAVTNPALRLCMTTDINSLPDSAMLKQERTSPVEFEQKL